MKTYWNFGLIKQMLADIFVVLKQAAQKLGLFRAQEILSVVLNNQIFWCSEMNSCLHEKGWGTNVTATKHKEALLIWSLLWTWVLETA